MKSDQKKCVGFNLLMNAQTTVSIFWVMYCTCACMFRYGYQVEGETVSLWKLRAIFFLHVQYVLFWRRNVRVGCIFSSSFDRQQQERQGQPCVLLLWLHRLLCGPGTDRFGDAHFQGCPTRPSVFGARLSGNTDHAGPHKRRSFRVVQVSWKYFTLLLVFVFCLSLFITPKLKVGHSWFQRFRV